MKRLIMFARLSVIQSLATGSSELSGIYRSLCPGNAIRQVSIKSQLSQCTLLEFQYWRENYLDEAPYDAK